MVGRQRVADIKNTGGDIFSTDGPRLRVPVKINLSYDIWIDMDFLPSPRVKHEPGSMRRM